MCDNISIPEEERLEIIQLLIDNGAPVNARNKERETPLHLAARICSNDDFTMLKILIDAGARRNIVTRGGKRPIDLCRQKRDRPKRRILKSYGRKWWHLF